MLTHSSGNSSPRARQPTQRFARGFKNSAPRGRAPGLIALTLCACAFAFLAPAARAQSLPWGVYLCQYVIVGVAADPAVPDVTFQYPLAGCSSTFVQTVPLTNGFDSGSVVGMGPGYSDNGEAAVTANATLGTLSAALSVNAVSDKGIVSTGAEESLGWNDTFTITSSAGLAKGTPVTLNITMNYSGKVEPPISGSDEVYMQFLTYNAPSPVPLQISDPGIYVYALDGPGSTSATLQVHVGDTFQLGARMNTSLSASEGDSTSNGSIGPADGTLSSAFTFTLNIDPAQPCISYTTASGTPYFSKSAPAPCSGPPTCAQIVQGQVHTATGWGTGVPNQGLPITIGAKFTPNYGLTLEDAATACGFDHFNFQQVVTEDYGPPPATCSSQTPTAPYVDPPPGGWQDLGCDNPYPFYISQANLADGPVPHFCPLNADLPIKNDSTNTLTFCDAPNNPALTPGILTSGHTDSFWTALVGVTASGQPFGAPTNTCENLVCNNAATLTPLWTMTWTDSFDGAREGGIMGPFLGGISSMPPPDPTSGTGGIVIVNSGTPLVGDVNGDGVVNCADLAVVKASFAKKLGQAGFDPRADVNFDGVVNIVDLSTVARALPAGTVCH